MRVLTLFIPLFFAACAASGCSTVGAREQGVSPAHRVAELLFERFNQHNVAGMRALYAEDAEHVSPSLCAARHGPDAIVAIYSELFEQMPDVHDDVEQIIADNDSAAVRFTGRSAARGFELQMVALIEVRGGVIVRERTFYDTGGRRCA